jgi:hypothetical protein
MEQADGLEAHLATARQEATNLRMERDEAKTLTEASNALAITLRAELEEVRDTRIHTLAQTCEAEM